MIIYRNNVKMLITLRTGVKWMEDVQPSFMFGGNDGSGREISPGLCLADALIEKGWSAAEVILYLAKNVEAVGKQNQQFLVELIVKYFEGSISRMAYSVQMSLKKKSLSDEEMAKEGFQNFWVMVVSTWTDWNEQRSSDCRSADDLLAGHWLLEIAQGEQRRKLAGHLVERMAALMGSLIAKDAYVELVRLKRLQKDTPLLLLMETDASRRDTVEARFIELLQIENLRQSPEWNEAGSLKNELIQLIDAEGGNGKEHVRKLWDDIRTWESSGRQL